MSSSSKSNPLIFDLLKKYQDDPMSRVFAPLAEAYRKAGMVDEAIEISREGLAVHPYFMGGKVALARALFDKKLYHEVVDALSPVVEDVPDNLVAQRLLAEACLMLGLISESLNAYKILLYFMPYDDELVKIVQELESKAYEKGTLCLRKDPEFTTDFQIHAAPLAIHSDPATELRVQKEKRIKQVEILLTLFQRVGRYRMKSNTL